MKILYSLMLELYWILLRISIRPQLQGLELVKQDIEAGRTPVFALPHHTILLSVLAYAGHPATLLASLSKDGEFAAKFLKRRGFRLVRGSSSRGGKEAREQLDAALSNGEPVAITFDGPRGPRLIPKPGIALCGWRATGSVYLLKHRIRRLPLIGRRLSIRLKSWDRFELPLPGCFFECEFVRLPLPEKNAHSREEWVDLALQMIHEETVSFYADKS